MKGVHFLLPHRTSLSLLPSLFISAAVAVIGFSPVLYTAEEGSRSLSVNVTHQVGALGRTVALSVFTVDGSATGTVCVCVCVCVCGWVGVYRVGLVSVFRVYFVINLCGSSKGGWVFIMKY